MFGGSSQFTTTAEHCFLVCTQRFHNRELGSGRKLGGAFQHLIDSSEKRICSLNFELWSSHVIEKRINITRILNKVCFLTSVTF